MTPLGARLPRSVLALFGILVTSCLRIVGLAVLGIVQLAVDVVGLHQLLVGADGGDAAALHHDDAVGILHAGHALGNDDFGGLGDELPEALADQRVGAGIDGRSGVVQNQDLGLLQQGAGDAQTLFLAARDVGAALLDPGVILLGELLDELVGLGQTAGFLHLGVGGVGVATAQVVLCGAREQHVLLQHHGHLVAQGLQVVLAHVHAAHLHAALGDVVQAGDQLDQAGLGRTGAAQDADDLARLDVQVDVGQGVALGLFGILEA